NGQTITGNGNHFSFTGEHGTYELTFADGFTGDFASFTARSVASAFDLTGGDGAGNATGADSTAIINGETITGHDNHFTVHGAHGTYEIEFAEGFTGEFDSVTLRSQAAEFTVTGGDENGADFGSDFSATI